MKQLLHTMLCCLAIGSTTAQAALDDLWLDDLHFPTEQAVGRGQSALWTLPYLATQYTPHQSAEALQQAIAAHWEGRIIDAQIILDDARKLTQPGSAARVEIDLLRTSLMLQGEQFRVALDLLTPYLDHTTYGADAHAQAAMTYLMQSQGETALKHARQALTLARHDFLPNMVMSFVLQGAGQLEQAYQLMVEYNRAAAPSAMAVAREAELALMLDQTADAQHGAERAHGLDAANPYVAAVYGNTLLITGRNDAAHAAFDTALKYYERDAKALLGKALAEIKSGNPRAGLALLQRAQESEPRNAIILTYLGMAQQMNGQSGPALASWQRAQQLDPMDPAPWLYQARAELQAHRPLQAQHTLREAETRMHNRAVYRGARLLQHDAQLYQSNRAEIQRQLGQSQQAVLDLAALPGEKDGNTLRNLADLLQGQRFGESARRSLLLQSLFDAAPGGMLSELDVYGDGGGQTGASAPQHGEVSGLQSAHLSYNDFDNAFAHSGGAQLSAQTGSQNSQGTQLRLATGSDTVGLALAHRQYRSDGFNIRDPLDNRIAQGVVQWRPTAASQLFVTQHIFASQRGETFMPADAFMGSYAAIRDHSRVSRLGLRQRVSDTDELRALYSRQDTTQHIDGEFFPDPFFGIITFTQDGRSNGHGMELQYRRNTAAYSAQLGALQQRGHSSFPQSFAEYRPVVRQVYANWQQPLTASWQLEAGLGWGSYENLDQTGNGQTTRLQRWLPQLGLAYRPDERTRFNLAVWQGMGTALVGDATLAPATLAGVVLQQPGDQNNIVDAVALQGWRQLQTDWALAAAAQRRFLGGPTIEQGIQKLIEQRQDAVQLALHWQPTDLAWQASLAQEYEGREYLTTYTPLDSIIAQGLQATRLQLRWFASAHWSLALDLSHNRVDGIQTSLLAPELPYAERFNQADASLNWQQGAAGFSTGVRNLGNSRYQYADPDRLNPRYSSRRMLYARLKLDW